MDYEGPGLPRRPLGPDLLSPRMDRESPTAQEPVAARFVVDPAKAEKGRALFSSIGCASCHQLRQEGKPITARPGSRSLASLAPDAGCLASDPPRGVPDYNLSARQRAALSVALKPEGRKPTDKEAISRTLLAFNCYYVPRPRRLRWRGGRPRPRLRHDPEGDGRGGADPSAPDRSRRQADRNVAPPRPGRRRQGPALHADPDAQVRRAERRPPGRSAGEARRPPARRGPRPGRPRSQGQGNRPVHRRGPGVQLRELPSVPGVSRPPGSRRST